LWCKRLWCHLDGFAGKQLVRPNLFQFLQDLFVDALVEEGIADVRHDIFDDELVQFKLKVGRKKFRLVIIQNQ
jgi:hypothetical protein